MALATETQNRIDGDNDLHTKINTVQNNLQTQITNNANDIQALGEAVGMNEVDIAAKMAALMSLESRVLANEGDILTLEGDIAAEASARAAEDAILHGKIADNANDIAALHAKTQANMMAIATNAGDIATNAGDIDNLRTDLTAETNNRIAGDDALHTKIN